MEIAKIAKNGDSSCNFLEKFGNLKKLQENSAETWAGIFEKNKEFKNFLGKP